jgi:NAD(P)-dependent dehydrogenase (short-subunit alcohol dehydrogenase family)
MSKTIIVTGAASAYGRAIIQTLADEGHGVVAIMDLINEANLPAARELQQTVNVELVVIDVKDKYIRPIGAFPYPQTLWPYRCADQ